MLHTSEPVSPVPLQVGRMEGRQAVEHLGAGQAENLLILWFQVWGYQDFAGIKEGNHGGERHDCNLMSVHQRR